MLTMSTFKLKTSRLTPWMLMSTMLLSFMITQVVAAPLDKLEEDTPSPPVILEDPNQYIETGTEEYIDYEYSSSVEQELKEIHKILFRNDNANVTDSPTADDGIERKELELDELINDDSSSDFQPVGVQITALVSHSPDSASKDDAESVDSSSGVPEEQAEQADYDLPVHQQPQQPRHAGNGLDLEASGDESTTEMVVKEPVDDLTLALTWWQILLLIAACLLLASLCCYFSGCCFLTSDCCSDPFWGCCPCCRGCVRYTKPPPHTPKSSERDERRARSNYSLNENTTAPRSTIDRTTISTVRLEVDEVGHRSGRNGADGGASTLRSSTPMKPDRRNSRTSVRNNLAQSGQDSLTSNTSIHSGRTYTRRHSHNNSFRNSSGILVPGGGAHNQVRGANSLHDTSRGAASSLHASSRSITKVEDSLKIARKESVLRGEPSQDWIYEDSSGYFSWISKLGSGKKKQYSVYDKNKLKSSQKRNKKHRQSKYEHIADMRNSAVIPVKISKRASNASNFNVRPMRCRSVESISSEDEEVVQPFLQTKSERNLPSRLSTNLAELENNRVRKLSGSLTPVACPTVPDGFDTLGSSGPRRKVSRGSRHQSAAAAMNGTKVDPSAGLGGRNVMVHHSRDPIPGEDFNLKNFEKSLIASRETNV